MLLPTWRKRLMRENEKTRVIYNPMLDDVTIDVDKCGDNPQTFTLKAGEDKEYPLHIASIFEDKLVDKILWSNPPADKNYAKRREEILKLIRV